MGVNSYSGHSVIREMSVPDKLIPMASPGLAVCDWLTSSLKSLENELISS